MKLSEILTGSKHNEIKMNSKKHLKEIYNASINLEKKIHHLMKSDLLNGNHLEEKLFFASLALDEMNMVMEDYFRDIERSQSNIKQ